MRKKACLLWCRLAVALLVSTPAAALAQEQEQPAAAEDAATKSFEHALRLYRNRDFSRALEELTKVAEFSPDRADVHYLIGYSHLMLRQYEKSLDAFRRAFDEDPQFDPRTIYQKPKSP